MEQFPGLPGWKRSQCLGCGGPVVAARHPYVTIGGRRDGTSLFVIGLEPDRLKAEQPDTIDRDELCLLGVAHRSCVGQATVALRSGLVHLPLALPKVTVEDIDELPEQFHQPPTGRYCAFCGSQERLSDEHVWPKWISRALRRRAGVADRDRPFVITGKHMRRRRMIDISAPICAACNNRWLSTLENDAQSVLSPMITGKPRTLSKAEQVVVASWAVKTALMFDLSNGPEAIIPLGYYRDFALRRMPLKGMGAWIASYVGPNPAWARREALWVDISRNDHPNAFATTLVAGALVLQVAGHFVVSASFRDDRRQFADSMRLIWPTEFDSISWPPGQTVLDHDALVEFASSFGGRVVEDT